MINYKLDPTLKGKALTSLAVTLWNKDTLKSLASWENYSDHNLEKAELITRLKVAELILPKPLVKEMLNVIKVIGLELRTWVQFHERLGNFLGSNSPAASKFEFRWTSYGTIDRKRTAQAVIEDEDVDALTRYKYACQYCLESSICNLWGKLDRSSRKAVKCFQVDLRFEPHTFVPAVNIHKDRILIFWSYIMDSDANQITGVNFPEHISYRYPFEGAVFGGNDIAVKYFIQKMTTKERELSLVRAVNLLAAFSRISFPNLKRSFKMYYSNVMCLLLSSMNETEQTEVFKSHACEVLKSLLEWPWQQFFISTAELVQPYLSVNDSHFLMCQFLSPDYLKVYTDYDYQDVFQKFWEQSPPTHKKFILDGPVYQMLLNSFFAGQKENILMIMQHATPEQNLRIIRDSRRLYYYLIVSENLNILKYLLLKSIPPGNDSKIMELNAGLVPITVTDMASKKAEAKKRFQFVSNFVASLSKRSLEEDEIPLKKTCIEYQGNKALGLKKSA